MLEKIFKLKAHRTNVRTEILAGVTTFLAMAYILFVNPSILGATAASFYLPAVCALLRPEESKTYVAAGHEVGIHGWIHERNSLLDYATERELMLRAAEVLEKTSAGLKRQAWPVPERAEAAMPCPAYPHRWTVLSRHR